MGVRVGGTDSDGLPAPKYWHQPPPRFTPFDAGRGHNFPLKEESHSVLGAFTIVSEQDDYLVCEGQDGQEVNVAKPRLLRRAPWDGRTIELAGKQVTFQYQLDSTGGGRLRRIARAIVPAQTEEDEDEEIVEVQRITMDYLKDDILIAAKDLTGTATGDSSIEWVDLNFGGRCWAVSLDEEA